MERNGDTSVQHEGRIKRYTGPLDAEQSNPSGSLDTQSAVTLEPTQDRQAMYDAVVQRQQEPVRPRPQHLAIYGFTFLQNDFDDSREMLHVTEYVETIVMMHTTVMMSTSENQ